MTDVCVEQIKAKILNVKNFITKVQEHGKFVSLNELYTTDLPHNKIVVGVINHISAIIKKHKRSLLVVCLHEVKADHTKGKLFTLYAFNEFATGLANACVREGDYAAFRSAYAEENTKYNIESGCHDLQARIGLPARDGAKIFFMRKPIHRISGKYNDSTSLTRIPSPTSSIFERESLISVSPSTLRVHNTSPRVSPTRSIGELSPRLPVVPDNVVKSPTISTSKVMYTYKSISQLVEPEKKVNIYGVISSITKMPTETQKRAVVRLVDESCHPEQEFRVHIFLKYEQTMPKLEHGCILRLHRMKTEFYIDGLDGRVFRGSDVVTFPPKGKGIEGAYSTATGFHFDETDVKRLTELRKWISSSVHVPAVSDVQTVTAVAPQISHPPPPRSLHSSPPSQISNSPSSHTPSLVHTKPSSEEPVEALLSEINKEGSYILHCKVLNVDNLSNEMVILTVTDGTMCTYGLFFDQDSQTQQEKYKTRDIRIIVLNPPTEMKKVKRGCLVKLSNVKAQMAILPDAQCIVPVLSFKLSGSDCSLQMLKGFEQKAVHLKRRLQDVRIEQAHHSADSVDLLIQTELEKPGPSRTQTHINHIPKLLSSSSSSSSSSSTISQIDASHRKRIHSTERNSQEKTTRKKTKRNQVESPVSEATHNNILKKRNVSLINTNSEKVHRTQRVLADSSDSDSKDSESPVLGSEEVLSSSQKETDANRNHNSVWLSTLKKPYSCNDPSISGVEGLKPASRQTSLKSDIHKQSSSNTRVVCELVNTNNDILSSVVLSDALGCNLASAVCTTNFTESPSAQNLISPEVLDQCNEKSLCEQNENIHKSSLHSKQCSASAPSTPSSKEQYKSAVSSLLSSSLTDRDISVPDLELNEDQNISSSIHEKEPTNNFATGSCGESGNLLSLPQKLLRTTSAPVLPSDTCGTPQKLQRNITLPLTPPGTGIIITNNKEFKKVMKDIGRKVKEKHCNSGTGINIARLRTLDDSNKVELLSNKCKSVCQTVPGPDESSAHAKIPLSDDTVDYAIRDLCETTTDPTNSSPLLSVLHKLAADATSELTPTDDTSASIQESGSGEEVSSSRRNIKNVMLSPGNKSPFRIMPPNRMESADHNDSIVCNEPQSCVQKTRHQIYVERERVVLSGSVSQQSAQSMDWSTFNSHPSQMPQEQRLKSATKKDKFQVVEEEEHAQLNSECADIHPQEPVPHSPELSRPALQENTDIHPQEPVPHSPELSRPTLQENTDIHPEEPVPHNPELSRPVLQENTDIHPEEPVPHSRELSRPALQENTARQEDSVKESTQELSESYSEFAVSVQRKDGVQCFTSTQSSGSQDNGVVTHKEAGDDEMSDVTSSTSEIVSPSETDDPASSAKFSALMQASSSANATDTLCETETNSSQRISSENILAENICFTNNSVTSYTSSNNSTKVSKVQKSRTSNTCECEALQGGENPEAEDRLTVDNSMSDSETSVKKQVEDVRKLGDTKSCGEDCISEVKVVQGVVPANISVIKRKRRCKKKQVIYMLKAWLTDIEPPQKEDSSPANIVSWYCHMCKEMYTYDTVDLNPGVNSPLCKYCLQQDVRNFTEMTFMLRFHLIDKNNDELTATVCGESAVDLLGCTVTSFLEDDTTCRRVRQMLAQLTLPNKDVPIEDRGPVLKLLITPVFTQCGMEYLIHNTYLHMK